MIIHSATVELHPTDIRLLTESGLPVAPTGTPRGEVVPIGRADLASRLRALPVARLDPPDDALLRGVLVKHFADRQIAVEEPVISYLMLRMPRSLDAARALVGELDALALAEKTAVTRGLAARVLQQMTEPGLSPDEG